MPMFHAFINVAVLPMLHAGSHVVTIPKFEPSTFVKALAKYMVAIETEFFNQTVKFTQNIITTPIAKSSGFG